MSESSSVNLQPAASHRLLISCAHPDDESFGLGGAIARYVQSGVEVRLICATNGESGSVDPQYLEGFASIAERRLYELDCAASRLGIAAVDKFGYRDSGMMGSPDNDHPDSLWQADQEEVAGRVVRVIRDFCPQVIITFDAFGGYGHPDHQAIHRATVRAFHDAADAAKYPEHLANGLTTYQPQKLYFVAFPRAMIRLNIWQARLRGQDPRHVGKNKDMDLLAIMDKTLPVHARLDLRRYYDDWQQANACHASQFSPRQPWFLPKFVMRRIFGWQNFYRAWPEVNGHVPLEHDLFEGVT